VRFYDSVYVNDDFVYALSRVFYFEFVGEQAKHVFYAQWTLLDMWGFIFAALIIADFVTILATFISLRVPSQRIF